MFQMQRTILIFIFLTSCGQAFPQLNCPTLNAPENGETNVPVDALITWTAVEGVPGYLVAIGTAPGTDNILSQRSIGTATSIKPPMGLPADTDIYITITLFFFDRDNVECGSEVFRTEVVTSRPDCTNLRYPENGQINVEVGTTISWDYVPKATGYELSLGTSPGNNDIIDGVRILGGTSYRPENVLPQDVGIFVTIIPFNANGSALNPCETFRFTTGATQSLPDCSQLISPIDGATDVPLTPFLEWTEIPEASNYLVSIGSSPFDNDVLDRVTFKNTSTFVIDFEPNRTYFTTIVPFNSAGEAFGCVQTSFSTTIGCGPFIDFESGELYYLAPEISLPEQISFCQNEIPFTISTNDTAEGYRWFRIHSDNTETLLSSTPSVELSESGLYRYEAYTIIEQLNEDLECISSKVFEVVTSSEAIIANLEVTEQDESLSIKVEAEGTGEFEYAMDFGDGPYQESAIFENVDISTHTFYLRDKNGCGLDTELFEPDLSQEGFPKFFTPNGDGVNDFWQYIPPQDAQILEIGTISIFDRYGTLLARIDPQSQGWNGAFNGNPLPSSNYWFETLDSNRQEVRGYFGLVR